MCQCASLSHRLPAITPRASNRRSITSLRCRSNSAARCFCKDTSEKGCWHARADFTIQYKLPDGRTVRAGGAWTFSVVNADDGSVLGTASYDLR